MSSDHVSTLLCIHLMSVFCFPFKSQTALSILCGAYCNEIQAEWSCLDAVVLQMIIRVFLPSKRAFFSGLISFVFLSNRTCNTCILERKVAAFMEGHNRYCKSCGAVIRRHFLMLRSVCISMNVAPSPHPAPADRGSLHQSSL